MRDANTTPQGAEFAGATLSGLMDHILEKHHAYLRAALPSLTELSHSAKNGAPPETAGRLAQIVRDLRSELESHMWKEEMVLFPLIRVLEEAEANGKPAPASHCGSVQNPIRVMEHEHAGAKEALRSLREITGDYGAGGTPPALYAALAELDQDLHRHIHLEDDILFPQAVALESRVSR